MDTDVDVDVDVGARLLAFGVCFGGGEVFTHTRQDGTGQDRTVFFCFCGLFLFFRTNSRYPSSLQYRQKDAGGV